MYVVFNVFLKINMFIYVYLYVMKKIMELVVLVILFRICLLYKNNLLFFIFKK